MKYYVMTLFPDMIEDVMSKSILGRARQKGQIELIVKNIRDFTLDKHGKVDDYPYGGGAGMVMEAEPVYRCYEDICSECGHRADVVYLTPQGRVLSQRIVGEYAMRDEIVFLCGHYEGIDERVITEIVTDEISIGDYVLTGGELPAMVMMDAVARMIPGVLHNDDSAYDESFSDGLLEYPQYTRPEEYHGERVPDILLSGHHENVDKWRYEKAKERTKSRRPDMYEKWFANNT